jgi:hypothetical protein
MNRFSPVVFGVKAHEFFEVPILDRTRSFGQSHYGISRVFVVLRDLWTIPFAIRGPAKWWPRFRRMQWTAWGAFVGLPSPKPRPRGRARAGLMAYANATNEALPPLRFHQSFASGASLKPRIVRYLSRCRRRLLGKSSAKILAAADCSVKAVVDLHQDNRAYVQELPRHPNLRLLPCARPPISTV